MKWRSCNLGDVITLKRGHDLPSDSRQDGDVPVVSSSGITGFHNQARAEPPGVVTGRYGTIGEVFYLERDYWPLNTALYVIDFKGTHPRFAAYFLKNALRDYQSDKAAIPGVDRNVVHGFQVRVPDRETQERIAETLSAYDDLIENNRRRMALLEESARLLYREWFVRLRFPGHEHTRNVNGVPVGWKKGHLGDFVENGMVDIQTGPFGTQLKASDYTEDGTPVINVRNIGYGDLRPDKLEYVPEEITDRLSVHLLREGDIVFGRKGAVDRHILVSSSQNGWMQGSDCIRMRSLSDEVCPVLLTFAFREPSHHEWMLTQCGNKATMASLNQGVISRIPAIVPSKILQDEFRLFATDCLDQMTTLAQQNQKLRTARDLLLPKLMSGEIEV
jgi:type I restriction enzyme S subunit